MLVKVTNECSMGCLHCMEDSRPRTGLHMTVETFASALDFTVRIEELGYRLGIPPTIMLSGGEPTEHPMAPVFIRAAIEAGFFVMLLTNGMWLGDQEVSTAILRPEWARDLIIQVTNDPEFYPKEPPDPPIDSPVKITYVRQLSRYIQLGRGTKVVGTVAAREAPSSFNLRSLTRAHGDVRVAVATLRARALGGQMGMCIPSISYDGTVRAGETGACFQIGTVESTADEVTAALLAMGSCNRCGTETNLSPAHKRAIGISTLFGPNE